MITPSNEQNKAIKAIVDWFENSEQQEFFLDGEAGTGKTYMTQVALAEIEDRNPEVNIQQAAYTAKAALVMRQKGAYNASTIHRMIYKANHDNTGKLSWTRWDNGPAKNADLIVIDEVSMVNDTVADDLRSFGAKILVLGDVHGQLPPIEGQGAFTRREPDFRLLELNRFAMEDPINQIAQRARKGLRLFPAFSEGGVKITYLTPETAKQYLYSNESQIICGRHMVRWATTRNRRAALGYHDPLPRVGEPLLCCQNNYYIGLLNGQFMDATYIHEEGRLMMKWTTRDDEDTETPEPIEVSRHLFDSHYTDAKQAEPTFNRDVAWMDWGYAITAHKAQGSEWPHVTIIDDSQSFRWAPDMKRRWLYTAITRASQGLVLLLRK